MKGYDDIIDLPHPTSKKHPRMSRLDRAAQFSPFAALTGFDAAIDEASRVTRDRIELDESQRQELDRALREAYEKNLPVEITRFVPDARRSGGSYETVTGVIRALDSTTLKVILTDGTKIDVNDILDVEL